MLVNNTNLHELTRKAAGLMSETEDVARLLKARLGAEHHLVQSANAMNASLQSLAHELRIYCDSDNHDQIGVSEDT